MYFLNFIFFIQFLKCLLTAEVFTKNVTCLSAKENIQGQEPVSIILEGINNNTKRIPYDNYMPENITLVLNCTNTYDCLPVKLTSMAELTAPNLILKNCFTKNHTLCETIRFNNLSKFVKLLFLSKTISDKSFYFVYCSVNSNGTQTCYDKDGDEYTKLVHKTNQEHVSVFDEFICEEDKPKSEIHNHRNTLSRRQYDMLQNPCKNDPIPEDIDCTKDVCVSWQGQIVDCEQTDSIPEPEHSQDEPFVKYSPEFKRKLNGQNNKNTGAEKVKKGDKKGKHLRNATLFYDFHPKKVLLKLTGILLLKRPGGSLLTEFKHNNSHEIGEGRCAGLINCQQVVKHPLQYRLDGYGVPEATKDEMLNQEPKPQKQRKDPIVVESNLPNNPPPPPPDEEENNPDPENDE